MQVVWSSFISGSRCSSCGSGGGLVFRNDITVTVPIPISWGFPIFDGFWHHGSGTPYSALTWTYRFIIFNIQTFLTDRTWRHLLKILHKKIAIAVNKSFGVYYEPVIMSLSSLCCRLFKTIYTKHSLLYKVLIRHIYPIYIKTPAVSIQIKPRSEIAPFENQYYVISAAIFTFTFSQRERENNKF